eukprot:gene2550-4979_t
MSVVSSCTVLLEYTDKRWKHIITRRVRKNTSISICNRSQTKEICLKSVSGNDLFISSNLVAYEKCDNLCIKVPEFFCTISISDVDYVEKDNLKLLLNYVTPDELFPSTQNKENDVAISNSISEISQTIGSPLKSQQITQTTPTKKSFKFGLLADHQNKREKSKDVTPVKSGYTPNTKKERRSPLFAADTNPKIQLSPFRMSQISSPAIQKMTKSKPQTLPLPSKKSPSRSPNLKITITPSQEQIQVINTCLQGKNVFLTGGAGTGKSTLLGSIIRQMQKKYGKDKVFVTATTGLAACAIGGTTIHQFAGIGHCEEEISDIVKQVLGRPFVVRRWRQARVLIVDEISMLAPKILEVLSAIGQRTRSSPLPLGGLQVIFSGDFFQLPPVSRSSALTFGFTSSLSQDANNNNTSAHRFCFQSPVWTELIQDSFILKHVFRQEQDTKFTELLEAIRWGDVRGDVIDSLNECVNRALDTSDGILATRIFTHRKEVDELNNRELSRLPGLMQAYTATDSGDPALPFLAQLQTHCPAHAVLKLKVGAQVMLLKAVDAAEGLVNGARGVVVSFTTETKRPVVRFSNGEERTISFETFSVSMGGTTMAQRSQLPLDLCWAVSVHKSQGMTVDKVELCLRKIFECGQAYVALSRVRTMDGLRLTSALTQGQIRADLNVVRFYRSIKK